MLLPLQLKSRLWNMYISHRWDLQIGKGSVVSRHSVFEGKTVVGEGCSIADCAIGQATYLAGGSRLSRTRIGRFCSLGRNVQTGFGLHPVRGFVSTHPAFFSPQKQAGFTFVEKTLFSEHKFTVDDRYFVEIGSDVWIGNDVRIMDGVRVGDGAVIGLGGVVTKDIEPYSINAGVPTKRIGYRFSAEQRAFLLGFKWWTRDLDWLQRHACQFRDIEEFTRTFGA
jgi:acetyltransferase-like isoleucine patch superfamily enzyme